jgi:antitoxin-like ribbon-helix-helix protein
MANTLKQGAAQLKELAGTALPAPATETDRPTQERKGGGSKSTVLIGAHFPRSVRRSIAQLQADPRNDGKKIADLLAEALNDLFAKYNVPQTANIDRESHG